jgi:hypothetical protein
MEKIKPELQLSGEDGNAFMIIARARSVARKAGWSEEEINQFIEEAKGGDYLHLLDVCEKYFEVL